MTIGWLEALVLDFDGTMVDTEQPEFEAWRAVWADHGVELLVADWAHCIGTVGAFDPLAELASRVGAVDEADTRAAHRRHHEALLAQTTIAPGVVAWLDEADAAGVPVGIASSSTLAWVEGHLERLGLAERIVTVAGFDTVGVAKPDPASYAAAVRALRTEPAHALAVEDSPHGVAAACAAGLRVVAVPGPLTSALDLSAAHLRLGSLAERTLGAVVELLADSV